jgi:TetR/AcrR family transcriptional repressor of nem operon
MIDIILSVKLGSTEGAKKMRASQQEMERSHQRIVDSAARLTRELGLQNASVAEVMSAAGLTHGGFYRHFASKEALSQAALTAAFEEMIARAETAAKERGATASRTFTEFYLSPQHVDNPGRGCPIAALASEVARESASVRLAFGQGVNRAAALIAGGLKGSEVRRRQAALRRLAMMAGAVMIARASDPQTAADVMAACRTDAA